MGLGAGVNSGIGGQIIQQVFPKEREQACDLNWFLRRNVLCLTGTRYVGYCQRPPGSFTYLILV